MANKPSITDDPDVQRVLRELRQGTRPVSAKAVAGKTGQIRKK